VKIKLYLSANYQFSILNLDKQLVIQIVIQIGARGKMKSTPFYTGKIEESFSRMRTSKVMYMNEKFVPTAMDLSKKVSQITRFKMKEEKFASENFQIMNYGIGGRITMHLDSFRSE
jgi:hypothetical protein